MDKKKCTNCNGTGRVTERELNTATSVALGSALGIGLFPSYHDVEKDCTWCWGKGER